MNEKRFQIFGDIVEDTLEVIPSTVWQIDEQKRKYCNELNKLSDENEALKLFEEKVFDLIDKKIEGCEEAIEWGKSMDADYGAMGFHLEMLKLLKKELEE